MTVDSGSQNIMRRQRSLEPEIFDFNHDPTKCTSNKPFVWCLQNDYNREKHPFSCKHSGKSKNLSNIYFSLVFQLENKSLPLKYNFNFVIDEISNINDKAQVCVSC